MELENENDNWNPNPDIKILDKLIVNFTSILRIKR